MESQLDVEHLQKLSYERSKSWSHFLEDVIKRETLKDFDIINVDKTFGIDNESEGELASMEEDEFHDITVDSEVLRNVTNTTRFSFLFNNKAVALPDNNKNDESKLIDIFNQTMPIINEHNRQLKEFGLDKILSSFDKNKIEEKVGSWLNRHNSLYGGDNTILLGEPNNKNKHERKVTFNNRYLFGKSNRRGVNSSNDSDDSLQSGETARYIRSSKVGAIKSSASTTTMIKTYRMVKSTREALREKYACENEDDYNLKSIRSRRKIAKNYEHHQNIYDLNRYHMSCKYEITPLSSQNPRRKVLRKRACSNSCSARDSSSDSEYSYRDYRTSHCRTYKSCGQHHCSKNKNCPSHTGISPALKGFKTQRNDAKMSSARMNRLYYYSCSQKKSPISSLSSSSSFSSVCRKQVSNKRSSKFCYDNRPCKRESDCYCSNEKKLCNEFRHIADTSTEEWYVENSYSPKKLKTADNSDKTLKPPTPVNHVVLENKKSKTKNHKLNQFVNMEDNISTIKTKTTKTLNPATPVIQAVIEDKKSKTKNKGDKKMKTKTSLKDASSEISDWELENVIEESKRLYKNEQKRRYENEMQEKEGKEYETVPMKLPREEASSKQEDEPTLNQTKYKKFTLKKKDDFPDLFQYSNNENEVEDKVLVKAEEPILQLKNLVSPPNVNEDTFFTASQSKAICNSTALSIKTQAYSREIVNQLVNKNETSKSTKLKKNKKDNGKVKKGTQKKLAASNAVTSTTIRTPELNLELTKTKEDIETIVITDDNSDSALVTSTTNIEPTFSTTVVEKIVEMEKLDNTSNSSHQLTQKDILIYTPENRDMAPAKSFTSDGYFTITKEHLSSIIGEQSAEKFLKYYVGRKRFNSKSTVYYRPPAVLPEGSTSFSSSSDSDDALETLGQHGDLFAVYK